MQSKISIRPFLLIFLIMVFVMTFFFLSALPEMIQQPKKAIGLIYSFCSIYGVIILVQSVYLYIFSKKVDTLHHTQIKQNKKQERLELAFDAGEIGFWDWDLDTSEVYFSPGYFTMLGYSPNEFPMTLDTWIKLLHPDDSKTVVPEVASYAKQAKPFEVEFRLKCKDQSWKWISGRGKSYNFDKKGKPQRAFGVHIDIDALKKSENKMSYLAAITEQAIEGIAVADFEGKIQYVNQAWVIMHGYDSADELIGKNLEIFHTKEQIEKDVIPFNMQVLENGEYSHEVGHMRKDGTTFPTFMNTALLKDSKGKPYALAGFSQDISEKKQNELKKKQAEEALLHALKETEIANNAKSNFLANMSHEIRTPMNGIIGMATVLNETALTMHQQQCVDIIIQSGDILMKLINDILNFSQIEAGKANLNFIDFNLNQIVKKTIDLMMPKAKDKKLSIRYLIDQNIPKLLKGDASRIHQVLIYLIDNAIKFTQEGEIIVFVSLEATREPFVEIQFTVKDTGIGIPPDKQNTIFSAFSQADVSSTREYGGSGLGLAISRQLISLMDGEIGVESESGAGSSFWFTIHLEKRPESQAAPKLESSQKKTAHILLVEDNPTNMFVIRSILKMLGYQVDTSENGVQALEMLKHTSYELILMDCHLPQMDGYEATKRIRESTDLACPPDIPIVALTARALTGDREKCLQIGMNDYMTKPADPKIIKEVLSRWIPHSQNEQKGKNDERIDSNNNIG